MSSLLTARTDVDRARALLATGPMRYSQLKLVLGGDYQRAITVLEHLEIMGEIDRCIEHGETHFRKVTK